MYTATCMACSYGQTVQEFCSNPDNKDILGCEGRANSSKLAITCFGENCGYNDEVSFCFEVNSDVDEEVECKTPDEKCCNGGGSWTFPAGRTEPKCGTLMDSDTA